MQWKQVEEKPKVFALIFQTGLLSLLGRKSRTAAYAAWRLYHYHRIHSGDSSQSQPSRLRSRQGCHPRIHPGPRPSGCRRWYSYQLCGARPDMDASSNQRRSTAKEDYGFRIRDADEATGTTGRSHAALRSARLPGVQLCHRRGLWRPRRP